MSPRRSAAVQLSNLLIEPDCSPEPLANAKPQLPLYLVPKQDEALVSWMMRLAGRLGVSMDTLSEQAFGQKKSTTARHWWLRPDPWMLGRVADKTGVMVPMLRRLTVQRWAPKYRDDEATERFAGRRYRQCSGEPKIRSWVVCNECLKECETPYLKLEWMIGWLAVCPTHQTVLANRCERCHTKFRFASTKADTKALPFRCTKCGTPWGSDGTFTAQPNVLNLQNALLIGKREGVTELLGIGELKWTETVALIDALLGSFWKDTSFDERHHIYREYEYATLHLERAESSPFHCRYGALSFLACLLEDWTSDAGCEGFGKLLLSRALEAKHQLISLHLGAQFLRAPNSLPDNISSQTRDRLWQLVGEGRRVEQEPQNERSRYSIHGYC